MALEPPIPDPLLGRSEPPLADAPLLPFLVKGGLLWFALPVAAIALSLLRARLGRSLDGRLVHALTGLALCALTVGLAHVTSRWPAPRARWAPLALGLLWVMLTLGFDLAQAAVVGAPLLTVLRPLHPSALLAGNLHLLVVLTLAVAPWLLRWLAQADQAISELKAQGQHSKPPPS